MAVALPKITPAMAAELAGTSAQYIRIRMQRNLFEPPIGSAIRLTGNRYNYDIRPHLLAEYLGVSVEEMYHKLGIQIAAGE